MINATSTNSGRQKYLPQDQHRHFGCFANVGGHILLVRKKEVRGKMMIKNKNYLKILFITIFSVCFACSKSVESHKPVVYAYEDGFELIDSKKDESNREYFCSVKLNEADSLRNINQITRYLISKNELRQIKKDLEKQQSINGRSYPIITIEIKEESSDVQNIDLSFHYSKSTYHYCYEVNGLNYKPKWSSFRTFGRNEKTYYENDK